MQVYKYLALKLKLTATVSATKCRAGGCCLGVTS